MADNENGTRDKGLKVPIVPSAKITESKSSPNTSNTAPYTASASQPLTSTTTVYTTTITPTTSVCTTTCVTSTESSGSHKKRLSVPGSTGTPVSTLDTTQKLLEKATKGVETLKRNGIVPKFCTETLETLEGLRCGLSGGRVYVATVGSMKAGKTTTLLSLCRPGILPTRTSAMTLLPTIVRNVPGLRVPGMQFPSAKKLSNLIHKIYQLLSRDRVDLVKPLKQRFPDEEPVIDLLARGKFRLNEKILGEDAICSQLLHLNDFMRVTMRLCEDIDGLECPLEILTDISDFPVVEVSFTANQLEDFPSNIDLVDLPGPDEHRMGLLTERVLGVCAQCALTILVVNSTTIGTKDSMDFWHLLQDMIEHRGVRVNGVRPRLLVVGNRIDMVRYKERSTVPRSISAKYDVPEREVIVFSALMAQLASQALAAVDQGIGLDDLLDLSWFPDFACLVWGSAWETDLEDSDTTLDAKMQRLRSGAADLVKNSKIQGFVPALQQAYHDSIPYQIILLVSRVTRELQGIRAGLMAELAQLEEKRDGIAGEIRKTEQERDQLQDKEQKVLQHQQTALEGIQKVMTQKFAPETETQFLRDELHRLLSHQGPFQSTTELEEEMKVIITRMDQFLRDHLYRELEKVQGMLTDTFKRAMVKHVNDCRMLFHDFDPPRVDSLVYFNPIQRKVCYSSSWRAFFDRFFRSFVPTEQLFISEQYLTSFLQERYELLRRELVRRYLARLRDNFTTAKDSFFYDQRRKLDAVQEALQSAQRDIQSFEQRCLMLNTSKKVVDNLLAMADELTSNLVATNGAASGFNLPRLPLDLKSQPQQHSPRTSTAELEKQAQSTSGGLLSTPSPAPSPRQTSPRSNKPFVRLPSPFRSRNKSSSPTPNSS